MEKEDNVTPKEDNGLEVWMTHRSQTFYIIVLLIFTSGMEFSIMATTLIVYVTEDIEVSNPDLLHALVSGLKFVQVFVLVIPVSTLIDRYRTIRMSMVCLTGIGCIGYSLYVVTLSPCFQLVGTILGGFVLILNPIVLSEVMRKYTAKEIPQRFLAVVISFGAGQAAGPLTVKILSHVDIRLGDIHITYGNVAFLALILLYMILFLLSIFFVKDLSKEFDLKAHMSGTSTTEDNYAELSSWKGLMQHFPHDAVLLLFQHVYTCYWCGGIFRMFPYIIQTFGYSNFTLNLCYLGTSVSVTLFSVILRCLKPSTQILYVIGLVNLVLLAFVQLVVMVIPRVTTATTTTTNVVFIMVAVCCYGFGIVADNTFLVTTLSKLFYSYNQTKMEGLRELFCYTALISSGLTSPYAYTNMDYIFPLSLVLCATLLVNMLVRRNDLRNPKPFERSETIPLIEKGDHQNINE